jgi:hypothetical protein
VQNVWSGHRNASTDQATAIGPRPRSSRAFIGDHVRPDYGIDLLNLLVEEVDMRAEPDEAPASL